MTRRATIATAIALALAAALGRPALAAEPRAPKGLEEPAVASAPETPPADPDGAAAAQAEPAPGESTPAKNDYLPYKEPDLPQSQGMGTVVGRVVGSLAIVVGLIFVTMIVLKRVLGGSKAPTTTRKVSELVEVTQLGGKRHLYLIRVADRLLVVGAGGDHLSLLSEIRDPDVLASVAALPRRSDFFELFHKVRTGAGRAGAEKDQAAAL